jgi:protein-tyrosine phosphatase
MKILFVCLGNICRSPLAKGIMRNKIRQRKLDASADSAGFERFHNGDPADPRSVMTAAKNGIDITDHQARMFRTEDFDLFDRIYVMDSINYSDVISLARNEKDRDKVDYIRNIVEPGLNKSVPDPYYGGPDGFEKVYAMLDEACNKLSDEIRR